MNTFWQNLNALTKGLLFMGGHLVGTTATDIAPSVAEKPLMPRTSEGDPKACSVAIPRQAKAA